MKNIQDLIKLIWGVLSKIKTLLLYIWQLPQNLVGLIYMKILSGEKQILDRKGVSFYIAPTMSGGVSFGKYVFLSKGIGDIEAVYDHEFGHCIQSIILGPLYLLVVGIPSGLHYLLHDESNNYYDFWVEKWANKLGGIDGYSGEYHYHKEGKIRTVYKELVSFLKDFLP